MCIMQSVCENATAKRHLLKVRFGFISIQFFSVFVLETNVCISKRQEANGARSIEPYGSIYCNIVWCCCTGLHPPTHEVAMHIIIIMVESVFGCACGPICAAHVRESMPTRMLWIIIVRAYRGGRRWSSRVCVCVCVWCIRIYYHQCHTATCAFVDRNHHVITPVFLYIFFNVLRFFLHAFESCCMQHCFFFCFTFLHSIILSLVQLRFFKHNLRLLGCFVRVRFTINLLAEQNTLCKQQIDGVAKIICIYEFDIRFSTNLINWLFGWMALVAKQLNGNYMDIMPILCMHSDSFVPWNHV